VLRLLMQEFSLSMALAGCAKVEQIDPSLIERA